MVKKIIRLTEADLTRLVKRKKVHNCGSEILER